MEKHEIYHLPTTLMQILDNTVDGVLLFGHDPAQLVRDGVHSDPTTRPPHEEAVKLAEYMFAIFQGFVANSKPCTSKAFIARLDPVVEMNPKKPKEVLLMANTCALLGMPGISPDKELAEFRSMLLFIKDTLDACFMLDNDAKVPTFHVFNSNSKLMQGIEFGHVPKEGPVKELTDKALSTLRTMIGDSLVLKGWLKHQRRMLNSRGPHCWNMIRTEDFYEDYESPSARYRINKRRMEEAATKKPPAEETIAVHLDF